MTTHTPLPPEAAGTTPTPPEANKPLFSKLVISGIAVAVLLIAVLAVALVNVLPRAFGSLASLYQTLHDAQNDRSLTISESATTIRSGDSVTLSWATTSPAGIYTFSYDCTDTPLTVEIRKADGLRNIRCDTTYSLGEVSSIEISARSEDTAPATLSYTISFLRTNDTNARASHTGAVTVTAGETSTPVAETPSETTDTPATEAPLVRIETPQLPRLETPSVTTITTYPTSNPYGYTDLAVRFIAIGTLSNKTFTPHASVLSNRQNALRFEVINLGTKTSRHWDYTVRLPNGDLYRSPEQSPLKPNERTTITISFEAGKPERNVLTSVAVDVDNDAVTLNDVFVTSISISR